MAVEPPSPLRSSMEHINESLLDTENTFEDADKATDPPETPGNGEIDDSDDESAPTTSEKWAGAKYEPPRLSLNLFILIANCITRISCILLYIHPIISTFFGYSFERVHTRFILQHACERCGHTGVTIT